jgi:hypothetical protein
MHAALEPTQQPNWVLSHEGYNVLTESAVESRFALGNGFLGMRAARSVSRGPTWVAWFGCIRWASWPRCYVAGLFDQHRAAPARTGARRRLVARAHPAGRRAAAGARGRSAPRHPQTRPAQWLAVVRLDASHPCRRYGNRAGAAAFVACGPRGRARPLSGPGRGPRDAPRVKKAFTASFRANPA